jgi:hypothetical protein
VKPLSPCVFVAEEGFSEWTHIYDFLMSKVIVIFVLSNNKKGNAK